MNRFAFRAGAAAAGGVFTRPFTEPLPVQAASFLMPVGGYGSARVAHFRYHEIISFKAGYTQVIGTTHVLADGTIVRETLASAVVEGLNILDVITADRVVARLTSTHPAPDAKNEMSASTVGSYFENLRIVGQPVMPACHPHLLKAVTKSNIMDANVPMFDPDAPRNSKPIAPARDATLRFSIFQPLQGAIAGAELLPGCRVTIPSVGDIYLGEVVVSADHRQLTMIRVDLHSPEAGCVAFGSVEGNGSVY
jgi:hypothetical protein